jgi:hypothetical protein
MITSIHLHGDSIFDNQAYVDEGKAVEDQLVKIAPGVRHILWATDGDTTKETVVALKDQHGVYVDNENVAVALSVGGNDALAVSDIMAQQVSSVHEAFQVIEEPLKHFRASYNRVLDSLEASYVKENIAIATVYDKIPGEHIGIGSPEMLALALFNNVITEEASRRKLKLLDLRVICDDDSHYSKVSPIEPSEDGGYAIAQAISRMFKL